MSKVRARARPPEGRFALRPRLQWLAVTDDVIAGITACAVQHGIWALAARVLH